MNEKSIKTFLHRTATAIAVIALPVVAQAAPIPVDLVGWQADGQGNWTVQSPGNDSVFQSVNGNPTVFFEAGSNARGTAISGTIEVETTGDDDFIGFVFGYQDGELNNSTSADFWLVDWKQNNQSPAQAGLRLSHVTGDTTNANGTAFSTYWPHSGFVNEVAVANTLATTGWLDNVLYTFDFSFTETLFKLSVDGVEQFNRAGSYSDGAYGFYNFSQASVRYAGITSSVLPPSNGVPEPTSLLLLGAGSVGLFAARRRRSLSVRS